MHHARGGVRQLLPQRPAGRAAPAGAGACPSDPASFAAPQCAAGVAQNWLLQAKCAGGAGTGGTCSTSTPVRYGSATGPSDGDTCRISVDGTGTITQSTGCTTDLAYGSFNCNCIPDDSPMWVQLTNGTESPMKISQVTPGTSTKTGTLCALPPGQACYVDTNFIATTQSAAGDPFDANWGGPGWSSARADYSVVAGSTPGYLTYNKT